MAQPALPTPPSDVLCHIACAALTALGSTKEARVRLSLVCRAWRDTLRGAPRHLVFSKKPTAEQLLSELASVPLAGVELHKSASKLPPESLSAVLSALAGSAANLTVLHSFPLVELQGSTDGGLSAFSQLRTLDLRQTMESPTVLRAAQLPSSIEELTLALGATLDQVCSEPGGVFGPTLVGFHSLHNLRRITFANYYDCQLCFADTEAEQRGPALLPPRLKTVRMEPRAGIVLADMLIGGLDGSGNNDEQTGDDQRSPKLSLLLRPRPLTLEIRAEVEIKMMYTAQYNRAGWMRAWEGEGTELPLGFATLRVETNALYCSAEERLRRAGLEAYCPDEPAQLTNRLCRAMRLAPVCYRRLKVAAAQPDKALMIKSNVILLCTDNNQSHHRDATFTNIAELAAAMRQFESAEGVKLCLTLDARSIVVVRDGLEPLMLQ